MRAVIGCIARGTLALACAALVTVGPTHAQDAPHALGAGGVVLPTGAFAERFGLGFGGRLSGVFRPWDWPVRLAPGAQVTVHTSDAAGEDGYNTDASLELAVRFPLELAGLRVEPVVAAGYGLRSRYRERRNPFTVVENYRARLLTSFAGLGVAWDRIGIETGLMYAYANGEPNVSIPLYLRLQF